jgi:hypothetical protein
LSGCKPTTQEKYEAVFDVFEQEMAPARLRSVDERMVSRFLAKLRVRERPSGKVGLAPITQRNYLVALRTALQWAVDQKMLPAVPTFPEVRVPKKKRGRTRPQPRDRRLTLGLRPCLHLRLVAA